MNSLTYYLCEDTRLKRYLPKIQIGDKIFVRDNRDEKIRVFYVDNIKNNKIIATEGMVNGNHVKQIYPSRHFTILKVNNTNILDPRLEADVYDAISKMDKKYTVTKLNRREAKRREYIDPTNHD